MRELKEETGYVGVVSESSPVMFNGLSISMSLSLSIGEKYVVPTLYKIVYIYYSISFPTTLRAALVNV